MVAEASKHTGGDAEVPQPDGDTIECVRVDGGCPADESVDASESRLTLITVSSSTKDDMQISHRERFFSLVANTAVNVAVCLQPAKQAFPA